MGKDPNSKNPGDYQAAFEVLKKVRPYITQFNSSGYINDLANNDVCVVLGWSGDVGIAHRRSAEAKRSYDIKFSNPKEGGLLWFDVMVIPKDAPHAEAALKWINYVSDPKVNAAITNTVFYPTANKAAHQFVTPAVARDPTVYPPEDVLKKMVLMKPMPADILRLENRLAGEDRPLIDLNSGGAGALHACPPEIRGPPSARARAHCSIRHEPSPVSRVLRLAWGAHACNP